MSRPCHCRDARVGPHTPDQCYPCWLALNTAEYGPAWGGGVPDNPLPPKAAPRAGVEPPPTAGPFRPCRFEGPVREPCHSCDTGERDVRWCLSDDFYDDRCTRGRVSLQVRSCRGCPKYEAETIKPTPIRTVRVEFEGHEINSSLLEYGGKLWLASRSGWTHANVSVSEMGNNYFPLRTRPVRLPHPLAARGREDPRLFLFRGQPHVAFTGYGGDGRVRQMVARLDGDFRAEAVWAPAYADAWPTEKNWAFFEWEGGLYSVYSISPHVVLRHDGGAAVEAARVPFAPDWRYGLLRGGASPVLVGGEFYHWFHGMTWRGEVKYYVAGLYTFAARPPFAPRRFSPLALIEPREAERPADWYASVVFPCGAVLSGGKWLVSYGHHDHWTEVAEFAAADVEAALRPVGVLEGGR